MSASVALPEFGNDTYLVFRLGDVVSLQDTAHRGNGYIVDEKLPFLEIAKRLLEVNDSRFIQLALSLSLKRFDGANFSSPKNVDISDYPAPLSSISAKIFQGIRQVVTG